MLRRVAHFVFLVGLLVGSVMGVGAAPPRMAQQPPHDPTPTPNLVLEFAPNGTSQSTSPSVAAPDCGPDLIPFTPSGWSFPVIPNSIKETVQANTTLFTQKPTYFDIVVSNIGTESVASGPKVHVWLDNTLMFSPTFSTMPSGHWGWFRDSQYTINSAGWHTVALEVDPDNTIAECNESNNYWEQDFYWEPVDGWWGEYFNNMNLAGDPVLVRDEFINFEWPGSPGPGVNEDGFSVRWTRSILLNAGTYRFSLTRDNGMRFYFDEVLVYDEWTNTVDEDVFIFDDVATGNHTMRVEMYESAGTATAIFERRPCFAVTKSSAPAGGGSVGVSPSPDCNTKYVGGQDVTLTASPAAGYAFSHWSGDVSGSTNPLTVSLQMGTNVVANFTQACYTLTTAVSPNGSGTVNASPGPNCAGGKYTPGTVVTLTANAGSGYTFDHWSGDVTGIANPRNVTMNANRSVTAHFTQPCYTLTTAVSPSSSGTVDASPGPDCAGGKYTSGTVVSLTANPGSGYTFASWSGDASGVANPRNLTMNGNKSVTANFTLVETYTLTVSASPAAGGNVIRNPDKSSYQAGEQVQVTAVANSGYHFATWSGSLGGSTNPATVTMNGNKSIVANFTQECYSLGLAVNPSGVGVINPSPPPNCGSQYAAGTIVSLTAVGSAGWTFANWSGDLSGAQNPKSVTMNGPRSVTAQFQERTVECHALTLDHTGQGADPQGAPPQSPGCDPGSYEAGTTVQLTADPANGWRVAGWRGTANNGATTLSNSLVMPAAAHTAWVDYTDDAPAGQQVALPMVLFGALYGYLDEMESEPNDDWDQGNGPLLANRDYRGYPDDRADWYYFDVPTAMNLVIALENITGNDPQLTLYYEDGNPSSRKEFRSAPPYIINYAAPPGRYYVRVYVEGDFNTTTRYTVRIGMP